MLRTIREILTDTELGQEVRVGGWVRSKRDKKGVVFIDIQDGSQQATLQLVGDVSILTPSFQKELMPGASVWGKGVVHASRGDGQAKEVLLSEIKCLGASSGEYPLQPKRHTLDFLRTIQHLRFRASTFRAVFRIRDRVCHAIHRFFEARDFLYLHTPIITGADAEGAGELFAIENRLGEERPFFGKRTYLTVSGQLAAESGALGLGRVYTFGPTFRAENSNTTRHLAEFWMVEPEMAFCELRDNIDLAEALIKYVVKEVLENCEDEVAFLTKQEKFKLQKSNVSLAERLKEVYTKPFVRMTYTEAIKLLKERKGKRFQYPIESWGDDIQTEHENYLVRKMGGALVVTDYPKGVKAFYMKGNEDGKTVAAMDVLLPGVGEVIGGSQREERYDKLVSVMKERGMVLDKMEWYLDTRRFGSVPHGGFGLGLERLVQFVTGMDNIRDVMPFPRTPGHAEG